MERGRRDRRRGRSGGSGGGSWSAAHRRTARRPRDVRPDREPRRPRRPTPHRPAPTPTQPDRDTRPPRRRRSMTCSGPTWWPCGPSTWPSRSAATGAGCGSRPRWATSGRVRLEVRPNQNRPCPAGQHNSTQVIYRDAERQRDVRAPSVTPASHGARPAAWSSTRSTTTGTSRHPRATRCSTRAQVEPVVVSARRKVSFCLRDTARVPEWMGTWDYPLSYGSCSRRTPPAGHLGRLDGRLPELPRRSVPPAPQEA